VTQDSPGSSPDLEIEAATVEDFLRLLKEREGRAAPEGSRSLLRRAVFLARILDQRSSRFGYPLVTRHVVAAFVYGGTLSAAGGSLLTLWSYPSLRAEPSRGSGRSTRR